MKTQLLAGLILTLAVAVQAETYTFRNGQNDYLGTDDAFIRLSSSNTAWGTAANIYIRSDGIHGLFRFDLSDLKGVIETVTNATLTLRDGSTDKGTNYVAMYRLLKPWVESQVTYNQYATGLAWETPGAAGATDRGQVLITNDMPVSVNGLNGITYSIKIPADLVQDWINNPSNNHGVLLVATNMKTVNLTASEVTPGITNCPLLTIEAVPKAIETFTYRNGVAGYAGTDDTYIWSIGGKSNLIFGADEYFVYMRGSDHIHGLFRFDLSTLKRVAEVASATLTLFDDSGDPVATNQAAMHRLLKNWGEAGATYLEYTNGSPWQTSGALGSTDRGPLLKTIGVSIGTHTNFDILLPPSLVEDWIANPSANYGFMLDPLGGNTGLIRPSEHATVSKRPLLTLKVVRLPPLGTLIGVK